MTSLHAISPGSNFNNTATGKTICIIPARAGSKRISRKNIRMFAGKPMIYWPIKAALGSKIFSDVVVSTDDKQIAEVAESHGASIPFYREERLSDDYTSTAEVTIDALRRLSSTSQQYDHVCCLYATAVFTKSHDLLASYQSLVASGSTTCLAVAPYQTTPFRALIKNSKNLLSPTLSAYQLTRSQDLPKAWHDAGQFCWSCTKTLIENGQVCMEDAIGYELEKYSVVDIDEESDFFFAERLFLLMSLHTQYE